MITKANDQKFYQRLLEQIMGYSTEDIEKIEPFLNEGQNPSIVFKYWQVMSQFGASWDSCTGFYHQIGVLFPEVCFVSNGHHFWIYRKTIIGGAKFRNFNFPLLKSAYIEEYPLWCKVRWTARKVIDLTHVEWTGDPEATTESWMRQPLHMDMLPKAQARRMLGLFQEFLMFWEEEWRVRMLDWYRFMSGTVVMREGSPEIFSEWNDLDSHVKGMADTDPKELPPVSEFEITPELHNRMLAKAEESQDPEILLEYSKQQLEKGLITEADYLQRKQEMLARI